MKKLIILSSLSVVALSQVVSADMWDMMGSGSGMMSSGAFGPGLLGLTYFALAVFIFSIIFWLTYNWLAKKR